MSALIPYSEALRLDAELVRVARGTSALRLAIGKALDALGSSGGHHELGFSSFEAYARERCERSGRWAADTRALWHKLQSLPATREALRIGAIGWSTAELLARHVTAESELAWLEKARGVTVRELRALLATEGKSDIDDDAEHEPTQQLTVTAQREDSWLLECARKVAEAVAGPLSADRLLQSLLAEGYSTLLERVPDCSELDDLDRIECDVATEAEAQATWCAERRRWRGEAEELCREHALSLAEFCTGNAAATAAPQNERSGPAEVIDRELRRLCSELSERDLALGILAEDARKADVWRRLGFATELQYVRERLGVSLSCLKAKRILASRAARVPELATALANGRIGYEAAYLLSRVVTQTTAEAWFRRAEHRTVKHLREEVEAAELLIRMGDGREQLPLDEQSLDTLFELERGIVSGDLFGRARDSWAGEGTKSKARDGSQMSGDVSARDVAETCDCGSQMSGDVSARDVAETCDCGSQMSGDVSAGGAAGTCHGASQMSGDVSAGGADAAQRDPSQMSGAVSAGGAAGTCHGGSQMSGDVSADVGADAAQRDASQMSGDVSAGGVAGTCHDGSQMSGDVSADAAPSCDRGSQMSGDVSARDGAQRDASQMSGDVSARDGAQRDASQMSGIRSASRLARRFGRVTLRWCVTEKTYRFWRALERVFVRVRARVCREPASFLRFLCENFCRTWLPALRNGCLTESGELPEYFHIYRRDAFRCSSPVCRRRDVTPHHLVFRSHGGGDEDENVASLCSWCHLHGVHEGRIAAEPPASRIRWRIGRSGTLRIDGRERHCRL